MSQNAIKPGQLSEQPEPVVDETSELVTDAPAIDEAPTVAEVVDSIRNESLDQPRAYLSEVHVPGGGE